MLNSMTGYGKGQALCGDVTYVIEIKSVNHRHCDVSVKAPRGLMGLESEIRKTVAERLKRGKIDVFINREFAESNSIVPQLNSALAASYVRIFQELRHQLGLSGDVPLELIAAQRDVIVTTEADISLADVREGLFLALDSALEAIRMMRANEGQATCLDMEVRLHTVDTLVSQLSERSSMIPIEWRDKLMARLEKLRTDFDYDPQRVAQELAIFADRSDISEELARLNSHLQQFRDLLQGTEPVGRQMDFLVQEMNREVNTSGSKSNDIELSRIVVALKSELEKIREQVQNIE